MVGKAVGGRGKADDALSFRRNPDNAFRVFYNLVSRSDEGGACGRDSSVGGKVSDEVEFGRVDQRLSVACACPDAPFTVFA